MTQKDCNKTIIKLHTNKKCSDSKRKARYISIIRGYIECSKDGIVDKDDKSITDSEEDESVMTSKQKWIQWTGSCSKKALKKGKQVIYIRISLSDYI